VGRGYGVGVGREGQEREGEGRSERRGEEVGRTGRLCRCSGGTALPFMGVAGG